MELKCVIVYGIYNIITYLFCFKTKFHANLFLKYSVCIFLKMCHFFIYDLVVNIIVLLIVPITYITELFDVDLYSTTLLFHLYLWNVKWCFVGTRCGLVFKLLKLSKKTLKIFFMTSWPKKCVTIFQNQNKRQKNYLSW